GMKYETGVGFSRTGLSPFRTEEADLERALHPPNMPGGVLTAVVEKSDLCSLGAALRAAHVRWTVPRIIHVRRLSL
ncbi:hypothetical protein RA988_19900, partial [Mycobacteroides abscessus subsp. massiliense]